MAPPGLTPHARPLRRAADEVQFGACPEHGLVLSGLDEVETQALLGLSRCPSLLRWQQEAVQHGVSERRLTQFIRVLGERGLLDPAGGAGSTRSRSHVCVLGQGLLPSAVRSQLELAGVGTVSGAWPLPPRARPDLVVLVVADAVGAAEATTWQRHALPHLPVISRAHDILVGPLVCRARVRVCSASTGTAAIVIGPGPACSCSWHRTPPRRRPTWAQTPR